MEIYEIQIIMFINGVLLGHAVSICLRIVCVCFHAVRAEFGSCNRDIVAHKAENIYRLVL